MEKPLISIVIPIYNVEKYLSICMESIFKQTYSNLEIIMVDDGSGEECAKKCDHYKEVDDRVKVYHKKNGGVASARNYGVERASGEYITWVDPDDYVERDYVEYLYFLLKKHNASLSVCQHRVKFENGSTSTKNKGLSYDEKLETKKCLEMMLYDDIVDTSVWAKLYHRDLYRNVRYPESKLFEDIGATYELMLQCDYIAVGYKIKYTYVFHDNSIVNSFFKPSKLDMMEMTDKMTTDVLAKYPDLKKGVLRRRVYSRFSTLNQMLETEDYQEEKEEIINFIKSNKKALMIDSKVPKRDKCAIILLISSYRAYRFCWLSYRRHIMTKKDQD